MDFSGASDAGGRIWVAEGVLDGTVLDVHRCHRAQELGPDCQDRDGCLAALRCYIVRSGPCVAGLDFPFGLPAPLVSQGTWVDFARDFMKADIDPEAFRRTCVALGGVSELKRATDVQTRTPFSPYNLRLYKQTFHGLRDVLAPLVRDELVSVLPMQRAVPDRPWLIEICPASTLKRLGWYLPYKGRGEDRRLARRRILRGLTGDGGLRLHGKDMRRTVLTDIGGDALDSVLAAWATARAVGSGALHQAPAQGVYGIEGYVYA